MTIIKDRNKLTPKEKEVAKAYVEGLQRKEIAERMNITVGTVKSHQHNIYVKLKVKNKIQLFNVMKLKGELDV